MARDTTNRLRELDKIGRSGSAPPLGPGEEPDVAIDALSFVMYSLLGLLVVVLLSVWFGIRSIESGLESKAEAALVAAGFDNVRADASGRDLEISGTVPAEDLIGIAIETVSGVEGVGAIDAKLEVVLPTVEVPVVIVGDPLTITWSPSGVSVVGDLSDEATRAALVDFLAGEFGRQPDDSGLAVKGGIASEQEWFTEVLQALQSAAGAVDTGEITVNPSAGVVIVAAELKTRQDRRELRDRTAEILAASGLSFVSGFTVEDAPPPPRREQVVELQENLDDLIEGKVVEFELNSDVITETGRALLDEILEALRQFPDVPVEIGGHADSQGSAEDNLDLSTRRAEAVLAYLVANGEDPERFVVVGYGETRPIADNSTAEGRARNRRIEFTALEE